MAGGQVVTVSAGSVGASITVALTGLVVTIAAGSLSPNNDGSVPLTGQAVQVQQGAVAPSGVRALTGVVATVEQGSLGVANQPPALTGQQVNVTAGALSASGNDVTVHLSGIEATFSQGILESGGTLVAGQQVVSAVGNVTPSTAVELTGLSLTVQQGSLAPTQDAADTLVTVLQGQMSPVTAVALLGQAVTLAQGTIGVTSDVSIPLVGQEVAVQQGPFGFSREFQLTGLEVVTAISSMGAPGGAALTGLQVNIQQGQIFTNNDRSVALVGQEVVIQQGFAVSSALAFVIGQEIIVQQQSIGPRSVELTGLVVSIEQGFMALPLIPTPPPGGGGGGPRPKPPSPPPRPPTHPPVTPPLHPIIDTPVTHPDDEKVFREAARRVIKGDFDAE